MYVCMYVCMYVFIGHTGTFFRKSGWTPMEFGGCVLNINVFHDDDMNAQPKTATFLSTTMDSLKYMHQKP